MAADSPVLDTQVTATPPSGNGANGGFGTSSTASRRLAAARQKAAAGKVAPVMAPRPGSDDTLVTVATPVAAGAVVAASAPGRPVARATEPSTRSAPTARRGRRVRRVVRRIELWSVLKLSLVLYTCLYLAVLGVIVVVWGLAYSSGQIDNLQKFLADVGLENYRFYGDQMFRACAAIGAVGVLAGTIITVLTAAMVNVISEITGGIRLVVIEEDPR